uniref:Palmitoyltransferase n=1 Tax=Chromera velia CCMP2878 TaxID=1169474 RepID=A0A0G4G130_9ALVE|eukprot:Cvel_19635.t1-p1 / transcript=Cvel_19635.t1 / gene=Cvel_19635 / organism=Chromera_velia_CCMP2878 / gene_product=Probable S-acyltransferase At5g04270, putative / transcript_product=Probable S-acyltransferase At5g04270, putative / location=Cvel_scaffold1709:30003-34991(+) / protein_length=400 / sequence_SO=supercontig / SO=protein_coding / is_pseudo=false
MLRATKRPTFQWGKALPVIFIVALIVSLYSIYMAFHIVPLWGLGSSWSPLAADRTTAFAHTIVFHVFFVLLVLCYVQVVRTEPGSIPDTGEWDCLVDEGAATPPAEGQPVTQETKRSGQRRRCRFCNKWKPDRAHHCRVCNSCVLKMDHHCPWIYNCVGYHNHKHFFLLLMYSPICCLFVTVTMVPTAWNSIEDEAPFVVMFFLLFGETLSLFLGVVTAGFLCFHIVLVSMNMTTIECCEKRRSGAKSLWDKGCVGNWAEVLGTNPFLWLVPFGPSPGDGLKFVSESTRLTADLESSRLGKRRIKRDNKGGLDGSLLISDGSLWPGGVRGKERGVYGPVGGATRPPSVARGHEREDPQASANPGGGRGGEVGEIGVSGSPAGGGGGDGKCVRQFAISVNH